MELEALKEKLGDETFSELETYVNDLVGQRDQARNESINGRKGLKAQLATLEDQQSELLEKLGIESFEGIDDVLTQGAAEASKQFEAKVKRLERNLQEVEKSRDGTESKYRNSLKEIALSKAFKGHEFVAEDVVSTFVNDRLTWEGDDLLFKSDDGNLVSVKDGVASFAKSRPELLKPQGTGGAGVRSSNARGSDDQLNMSRAEFEALSPDKQMEAAKGGVVLQ